MDSYGSILKSARENKGLEIEDASKSLTIESRYIRALEEEDSATFPGEAYLIGFLKNYSNFLDLDTEYLLKLYHNKKLQESPIPEGLIEKNRKKVLIPAIVIPAAILLLIIITVSTLLIIKNKKKTEDKVITADDTKNRQYTLTDKKFVQRVYKGDQFLVPTDNNSQIILTVRDTLSDFGLDTPSGVFYIELSEEAEIDITGDSISDMIVYVSDISSINEECGAEISMLLRKGSPVSAYAEVDVDSIPLATDFKAKQVQKVILEDNRAYPFTIKASFRGPCLFRDKVDREKSVEAYFSKGELFTATPHNGIRLWISNANAVNFTVVADGKTFDLGMGSAGEVLVEDIKWIKDTDGRYKLVVIDLE